MNPRGELPALKNPGAWPGALAWISAWDHGAHEGLTTLLAADWAAHYAQRERFGVSWLSLRGGL